MYAQDGEIHPDAKVMKGFKGSSVVEIVENFDSDTYRAVYTTKIKDIVYVLHCFQKKSKKGKETPKHEIELINRRIKAAEAKHTAKLKKIKEQENEK